MLGVLPFTKEEFAVFAGAIGDAFFCLTLLFIFFSLFFLSADAFAIGAC